jgi:signal transduction histidine kinase
MSDSEKMTALVQLAGAVAHELNNIFTAVSGNLSLLDEYIEQGSTPAEMIDETLRTAQRGIELSAKLQAFAGRQPLQRKQVNAELLLHEIVGELRSHLPKTVNLIFIPAPGDSQVFIDEGKLRGTIRELVANAVAAMNGAGSIQILLEDRHVTGREGLGLRPGDYFAIRVADTGPGMAPEIAARALDPMFSTKASHINTGWGLSSSAGFIRQSGGTMQLMSKPGGGTTIDLYLPSHAGDSQVMRRALRA